MDTLDALLEKIKAHVNENETRYIRALLAEKEARELDRRAANRKIEAMEKEIKVLRREAKTLRKELEDMKKCANEWSFDEDDYANNVQYSPTSPWTPTLLQSPTLPRSPRERDLSPPPSSRFTQKELDMGLKTIHPCKYCS